MNTFVSSERFSISAVLGKADSEIKKDNKTIDIVFGSESNSDGENIVFNNSYLLGKQSSKNDSVKLGSSTLSDLKKEKKDMIEKSIEKSMLALSFDPQYGLPIDSKLHSVSMRTYETLTRVALAGRDSNNKSVSFNFDLHKELFSGAKKLGFTSHSGHICPNYIVNLYCNPNFGDSSFYDKENKYTKDLVTSAINNARIKISYDRKIEMLKLEDSLDNNPASVIIVDNINNRVAEIHSSLLKLNALELSRQKDQCQVHNRRYQEKCLGNEESLVKSKNKLREERKNTEDNIRDTKVSKRIIGSCVLGLIKDIKCDVNQLLTNWIEDNLLIIGTECGKYSFNSDDKCSFEDNYVGKIFLSEIEFTLEVKDVAKPCTLYL